MESSSWGYVSSWGVALTFGLLCAAWGSRGPQLRGWLHGFRIPGGFALLLLCGPLAVRGFGLRWPGFASKHFPLLGAGVTILRAGCLANGCCFGVPWAGAFATTFNRFSPAYEFHSYHRWIPPGAETSLPVFPLQLAFLCCSSLATIAVVVVQRFRHDLPAPHLWFSLLWFFSSLVLEHWRQNFLHLNVLVEEIVLVLLVGAIAAACARHVSDTSGRPNLASGTLQSGPATDSSQLAGSHAPVLRR